jgi:O-antigen ligase
MILYETLVFQKRAFGFAGIMAVDYIGIGIIVITILFLYSSNLWKIFYLILLSLFGISSLLAQTRNPWITVILILFLLSAYLFAKGRNLYVKRSLIISIVVATIIIIFVAYLSVPQIQNSLQNKSSQGFDLSSNAFDQEGKTQNSLTTRLLIWHTALNAFSAHPLIGIGAYSFPFASANYYSIPKTLYKQYVEGLSPHIAYLAILTETGIFGLLGFILLLYQTIKYSFKTIKLSKSREDLRISLILFWTLVYIYISMFMTDAWLWGHGIILWAIILGLNVTNYKRLIKQPLAVKYLNEQT